MVLAQAKTRSMAQNSGGEFVPADYELQDLARKFRANQQSKALKEEIKEALDSTHYIPVISMNK